MIFEILRILVFLAFRYFHNQTKKGPTHTVLQRFKENSNSVRKFSKFQRTCMIPSSMHKICGTDGAVVKGFNLQIRFSNNSFELQSLNFSAKHSNMKQTIKRTTNCLHSIKFTSLQSYFIIRVFNFFRYKKVVDG